MHFGFKFKFNVIIKFMFVKDMFELIEYNENNIDR